MTVIPIHLSRSDVGAKDAPSGYQGTVVLKSPVTRVYY